MGAVTNKVDTYIVNNLEEKVDKNVKTLNRDINMSKKKIERLQRKTVSLERNQQSGDEEDGGNTNQHSGKALQDKKMSFDLYNNSKTRQLIPKLPFMKAGNRIASFG